MDLKDIVWVELHCIHVTQDMVKWLVVVNCVINCRAPEICKFSFHKRQKRGSMCAGALTMVAVTTSVF